MLHVVHSSSFGAAYWTARASHGQGYQALLAAAQCQAHLDMCHKPTTCQHSRHFWASVHAEPVACSGLTITIILAWLHGVYR